MASEYRLTVDLILFHCVDFHLMQELNVGTVYLGKEHVHFKQLVWSLL